jgi:serine/threonine protein kinase
LPDFPKECRILEWRTIAAGSHGEIRCIKAQHDREAVFALKLFTEEWKDAYVRERDAYTLMIHRGVKRCIPHVFYQGVLPRWKWDGEQSDDYEYVKRDEMLYGLVMDYFEDCREIDMKMTDMYLAEMLGETLKLIHEGGVVHRNIEERNILLVRESGKTRIVWIDFSNAWAGPMYKGTRSLEWDTFRGFLMDTMVFLAYSNWRLISQDPRVINDDILDQKFPRMPRESEEDREMSHKTQDESREMTNFQIEQAPPPYLRFAYGIFCFVQVSMLVVYWILSVDSMYYLSPSRIAATSLGVVFFMARKESLATEVGRNIIGLFLLHSIGSLSIAVYEHLCSYGRVSERKLHHIMIVLQVFWVLCGTLAVRNMLRLPIFF